MTLALSLAADHLPRGLSQENALAPPTGFARVLGGAALPVAEAGEDEAAAAPIEPIPFSPSKAFASVPLPLRLMPSSKNLLRPSAAGLEVEGAVDVPEKVRVAVLGLRTLIPVSLRW